MFSLINGRLLTMEKTGTDCDSNPTYMSHAQRPNDRVHFPRINASYMPISPYLLGDRSYMALNFTLSPRGQLESTQQQSSNLIACETPANIFSYSRAEGSPSTLIATRALPDHAIGPQPKLCTPAKRKPCMRCSTLKEKVWHFSTRSPLPC